MCDRSSARYFRYLTCLLDRGHISFPRSFPMLIYLYLYSSFLLHSGQIIHELLRRPSGQAAVA